MESGIQKLKSKKFPPWALPVFGYAVSIGSLIWVLQEVDLQRILYDLYTLHWGWVTLAVVADIMVYVWQGHRWNILLTPVVRPPLGRSVRAIYVGLFANEVLPLRTGELIRCYLQARWSRIPFSVALSSAIIERIFDGLWLMAAFFLATLFVPMPGPLVEAGRLLGFVIVFVAFALGMVMFRKHHAHWAVKQTRWAEKLRVLVDDLHAMGNSPSFYKAALASLPFLLIQVVPVYALMQAYPRLDPSVGAASVVLIILRLGTAIPQAPGNVGSFQALTVLGMAMFGIEKTTALGYSFIMWAVITLPLLIAGSIALAFTGIRFGDLRRHAQNGHCPTTMATVSPEVRS